MESKYGNVGYDVRWHWGKIVVSKKPQVTSVCTSTLFKKSSCFKKLMFYTQDIIQRTPDDHPDYHNLLTAKAAMVG